MFFDDFFAKNRFDVSEATFANLFMWRNCYLIEWDLWEGIIVLKPEIKDQVSIVPLVGQEAGDLKAFLNICSRYFRKRAIPFLLRGVTQDLAEKIVQTDPEKYNIELEREVSDYLYSAESLRTLKGRKLSRKRNHIRNFKKSYPDYLYTDLTLDLIPGVREFIKEWCRKRGCKDDADLRCERDAAFEALNNFQTLGLIGGVILIDGKIEAATFGEALNANTVIIRVEKGNTDLNGIYPTLNQEYLLKNWPDMEFVNREEDLGVPELRKAKESYYPLSLVKKYIVTCK